MDDEMSLADVFTAEELYEMDRDDEYRLDAQDAAAAEAEEASAYSDDEPWDGLADGEES